MKANELMIGDWCRRRIIYRDTGREVVTDFQITQICKNGENLYVYGPKGNMGRVDQIEPIPLTPEILEKNGWKETWGWWSSGDCSFFMVKYTDNSWAKGKYGVSFSEDKEADMFFIGSVHELQNALRLCGIEKTIEL